MTYMTWDQSYQRQMLFNQIAIMAGMKEHMLRQHGNERAAPSIERFDQAVKSCIELLQTQPDARRHRRMGPARCQRGGSPKVGALDD